MARVRGARIWWRSCPTGRQILRGRRLCKAAASSQAVPKEPSNQPGPDAAAAALDFQRHQQRSHLELQGLQDKLSATCSICGAAKQRRSAAKEGSHPHSEQKIARTPGAHTFLSLEGGYYADLLDYGKAQCERRSAIRSTRLLRAIWSIDHVPLQESQFRNSSAGFQGFAQLQ